MKRKQTLDELLGQLKETHEHIVDLLLNSDIDKLDGLYLKDKLAIIKKDIRTVELNKNALNDVPASFTLALVGDKFSISRERVRQIEDRGLKKIMVVETGRLLRDYLYD